MEKELQVLLVYLLRFFYEMENTNENTNLHKLADVKRSVAVRDIAREALSVSLESLLTSDFPIKLIRIATGAQSYRKMFIFTKLHGHKTVEIRVEHP